MTKKQREKFHSDNYQSILKQQIVNNYKNIRSEVARDSKNDQEIIQAQIDAIEKRVARENV